MKNLFQWLQALLLAPKFCCAVQSKSSRILSAALGCCSTQEPTAVVRLLADISACPSGKITRGESMYWAIRWDCYRKTKNINPTHLFELVKAKVLSPKLTGPRKEIREINREIIYIKFRTSDWGRQQVPQMIFVLFCISNLKRVDKKSVVLIIPEKCVLFPE